MKEYREKQKVDVYQVILAIKVIILVIIALDFEEVGWFLAHLVMSLYNHALSVMWCCHCNHVLLSSASVYSPPSDNFDHRNFISCKYDIYIFKWQQFLYLALLSTWLSLEPSYLVQLYIYTGATHREKNMHLSIIFLKF